MEQQVMPESSGKYHEKGPSSRPLRIAIGCIVIAVLVLGAGFLGVKVGIRYRTNRLLYEMSQQDSLREAVRVTLGMQKHYAAADQDLWIIYAVSPGKRDGYYVDVGSADGVVHSNTNLLDQMGWKGICVDPFPTGMTRRTCQMFRQPVFSESGKKVSFRAAGENGGVVDTLSRSANVAASAPMVDFVTATLDELLAKANAPRHIDFMSIDVEGAELEALRGLSFDKYQVDAIAIEHNNEKGKREGILRLLGSHGYVRVRSWVTDDWYVRQELAKRYEFRLDFGYAVEYP